MIRLTALWMFVAFFAAYAWRDWFKSLCALILMMAVVEHPDFPKTVLGIQGLNPWNLLFFVVFMAWLFARVREGLVWDLPKYASWLLVFYMGFVVIAFLRLAVDMRPLVELAEFMNTDPPSFAGQFSEGIINCLKWVVPGLMLYDGCRSEDRFRLATFCVVAVYALLAIQVIRWMPLAALSGGDDLAARSLKILENEVGYHRVNMSMLMAGGSWAVFCVRDLPRTMWVRLLTVAASAMVVLAMALTGGRTGMATWALIAIAFGVLKWRKLLILAPIAATLVVAFVPAVQDRLLEGFTDETIDTNASIEQHQFPEGDGPDMYTVTAGRTFAWPFVIEEIAGAPVLGYGREGMKRTGLTLFLLAEYGESFPHPHNMYLQWLLDNGVIGFIPVLLFYLFIGYVSMKLFLDKEDSNAVVIGGVSISLLLALLIAGVGSQTFYPREGAVGMWCAFGLALRVYVQQKYAVRATQKEKKQGKANFWGIARVRRAPRRSVYG